MPPRRLKKKSIKRLVEKRVAKAIEEYEKSRANLDSAGSSGGNPGNAGGTMNVHGCSHKTFMNGKPHTFNGTEGVVGLRRWIEKVEQVFETCKCAEEDKVMFAASTFEGRALTWWNGNVHTLGLVNANHIPWTEFKTMMTTEYCPATEIQRMEQELWTLTLKGDDIEAYNNRFHELALMCPELVPTEKKKIERYTRGFPERIKGNITSSKPATLHDAINMARELVEQAVQEFDVKWVWLMKRSFMTFELSETSPEVIPYDAVRLPHVREIKIQALDSDSQEVQFLGHVVNRDCIHVDPSKVESVKNWKTSESSTEIRSYLRAWRRIELLNDYERDIKYHHPSGKRQNVVADALSRKERLKPRRVRAMSITIHSGLKSKILKAQGEASKDLKALTEWLRGLEKLFKNET
ncbi:putative reverse transcriptase domain-containing protein [Tanacetum coccineum]